MKSRTFYAKKNMITGFLNRVIILGLPFIIRTVVIRKLGAEYLGLSSLFSSILQVLNMAELGFSSAVVFSLYKPMAENNTDEICALLSFYRRVYKVIGIVILVCGGILTPFLPYLIKGSYPIDINIYILYWIYLANTSISYLGFAYRNVIFSASQRQDILNNINSIVSITKFLIQIIVLLVFKNFYLYIIWNVVFTIIENIVVAILTRKYHPDYVCRGEITKEKRQTITKQIKGLAVGQLCKVTRNSFDSIVLSLYCGLIDVAIYSNYYYVFNAVMGLLSIIIQSINAGIGNSVSIEKKEKNYRDFQKFYFYFSAIGSICTVCFYNLYQPFMALWVGESLMASNTTMVLFCTYFYVVQMGLIRSAYANATGIWWECRKIEIVEMISNLLLNFLLGWLIGMNGILIATIVTVFACSIIGLTSVLYKHYFEKKLNSYLFASLIYCLITLLAIFVSSYIIRNIIAIGIVRIIINTFISLLASAGLWVIYGLIFPLTRIYIKDFTNKIIFGGTKKNG